MPNPASALRNLDTVVQQPAVEDGYVSTVQPAPVAFTDKLYVIVPEHSTTVPLGPCEWGAIHGSTLPKQGARCQVAFGGEEIPRVVWWEGLQGEDVDPKPEYVNALPGSPVNGQEVYYQAKGVVGESEMEKQGIVWHLRYRSGSASEYKWEFVGGAPLFNEQAESDANKEKSATYESLAHVGPEVALPLAGDYDVAIGFSTVSYYAFREVMSYEIGAVAAKDEDGVFQGFSQGAANLGDEGGSVARSRRKTGLTAVTIKAKYRAEQGGAGSASIKDRWIRATPVRV